jgi:hypothetical protein
MKVIVHKVLPWRQSKYNDSEYMRVAFKKYDGEKGSVYLNLTKNTTDNKWQSWIPYLQEGNVLNVTMHTSGNINQFEPFQVIDIKERNKV